MANDASLEEAVRREFAFLISDHGFRVTEAQDALVRLESQTLGVKVVLDRGPQVEVLIFRLGHESPTEAWRYSGMVGRASMPRLLVIARERLLSEESVLTGDPSFYEHLAREQRRESAEWTAYYSGKGPHPRKGKLP
jgi:hypothetical protein